MEVEYFEIPEMPGKPMFRCEKMSATISLYSCKSMWEHTHKKVGTDKWWQCKGCSIGAKHAGVGDATLSEIYGSPICARCERGTTRLIGGHVCVSCKNREYEYRKGRNARGNAPVTHPELHKVSIRYAAGGRIKTLTRDDVADRKELVIAVLRDESKQATFGMLSLVSPLPQLELFV